MHTSPLALAAVLTGFATSAFASDDPWALLAGIEIEEIDAQGDYMVKKTYPAGIAQGAESFRITGYAVPLTLEPGAATQEIMLVSDMGNCPFCGSSEHSATLQVELDRPVVLEEGAKVSVVGALELIDDPQTWQAAIMRGATLVEL
ncbi:MAG: hypothetical protein ACRBCL_09525 [Maritimibacter sp.]